MVWLVDGVGRLAGPWGNSVNEFRFRWLTSALRKLPQRARDVSPTPQQRLFAFQEARSRSLSEFLHLLRFSFNGHEFLSASTEVDNLPFDIPAAAGHAKTCFSRRHPYAASLYRIATPYR